MAVITGKDRIYLYSKYSGVNPSLDKFKRLYTYIPFHY